MIDTPERSQDIVAGIHQALSDEFQSMLPSVKSLYGTGNVSQQIKEKLKAVPLQTQKAFFDIEHNL